MVVRTRLLCVCPSLPAAWALSRELPFFAAKVYTRADSDHRDSGQGATVSGGGSADPWVAQRRVAVAAGGAVEA